MKLSNKGQGSFEKLKAEINNISEDLAKNLPSLKDTLTESQLKDVNDALAIAASLKDNFDKLSEEDAKRSTKRFAKLVKAAFAEDVSPLWLREKIKLNAEQLAKTVTPRAVGEGKVLGDFYKDMPQNSKGYTRSPIEHSRIAERILQDLNSHKYCSAQDAYDGYCMGSMAWPYASARQKLELAELLRAYGLQVDAKKWEKEYDENYAELVKLHGKDGQGKIDPDSKLISAKKNDTRDNMYCHKCKKTHLHNRKNINASWNCTGCERKKNQKKAQMFGMPMHDTLPPVPNDLPEADSDKADVRAKARELVDANDPMCVEIANSHGVELEHVKHLEWFLDEVVERLMPHPEGGEPEGHMEVMEEEETEPEEKENEEEEGEGLEKEGQKYDPYAGLESGNFEDRNTDKVRPDGKFEHIAMYDYACEGCGDKQQMEKHGDYKCAKCGSMMKYSDMGMGMGGDNNKMPEGLANSPDAGGVQPEMRSYDKSGAEYMDKVYAAAEKDEYFDVDTVAVFSKEWAENMKAAGMKKVKARVFLRQYLKD